MKTEPEVMTGKAFVKHLKISGLQMSSKDFKKKRQKMRQDEKIEERLAKERKAKRDAHETCG